MPYARIAIGARPTGIAIPHTAAATRPILSGGHSGPPLRDCAIVERLLRDWHALRRKREALVAVGGDLVARLAVFADAADVGHEDARLAGDVGAHVPGVR